jgi:hypothetical protein
MTLPPQAKSKLGDIPALRCNGARGVCRSSPVTVLQRPNAKEVTRSGGELQRSGIRVSRGLSIDAAIGRLRASPGRHSAGMRGGRASVRGRVRARPSVRFCSMSNPECHGTGRKGPSSSIFHQASIKRPSTSATRTARDPPVPSPESSSHSSGTTRSSMDRCNPGQQSLLTLGKPLTWQGTSNPSQRAPRQWRTEVRWDWRRISLFGEVAARRSGSQGCRGDGVV